jgi:hypothetical protein
MAAIGRLREQQGTGALSEPRELEMGVTVRYKQRSRGREEI